jgi:DNA helicase IV
VIVRDQSQKEELPRCLQNMLCLTVYEAKGLEFDDVILYNFFNSGEVKAQTWKIINDVELTQGDIDIQSIIKGLDNLDEKSSKERLQETIIN